GGGRGGSGGIDGVRGIAVAIGDAERKDVAFASQSPDLFPIQEAGRDAVGLRETHDVARQALHHGCPDPDGCEAIETRGARQHERTGVPRFIGTEHAIPPSSPARRAPRGTTDSVRAVHADRIATRSAHTDASTALGLALVPGCRPPQWWAARWASGVHARRCL